MGSLRLKLGLGTLCLALLSPTARGAAAVPPPGAGDRIAALAAQVDRRLEAGYAAARVTPAAVADDAEFVRRAYLDVAGRIPRVSEVRAFLDDRRPDKRRRLVEQLLNGPHYVNHFANVWRALLLPQTNNQQVQFLGGQIEGWVRVRLQNNTPYDRMVRELLTSPVSFNPRPGRPARPYNPSQQGAMAFYQANEFKPDNLAAHTSRLFLGVKIECAQCHDHPFAKWTRRQFWEYTAFFGGIRPQMVGNGRFVPAGDDPTVHEIALPGSEKKVQARFLDGKRPEWAGGAESRAVLAEWMTAANNPYFARAAVNRMWEHFFGVGLVDPVDDFREENPATHPELLDELARAFAESKFDPKFLVRVITATKAYQRTSLVTQRGQEAPRLFARMNLKGLTGEQLFDSLAIATGYRGNQQFGTPVFFFPGNNNPRAEFLAKFANPVDKKTEYQTSILQALALMNGKFVADATSLGRSEVLAAVVDSPFMTDRQRLDTLFLAALARPMRPQEASRLTAYVAAGGPSGSSKKALADVYWVLLNSSEFILNH